MSYELTVDVSGEEFGGSSEYHGRVVGKAIEGAVKSGGSTTAWSTRR